MLFSSLGIVLRIEEVEVATTVAKVEFVVSVTELGKATFVA